MTDREKVIDALKACAREDVTVLCGDAGCPYWDDDNCTGKMARDALELLKAQEPQTVSGWVSVKDRLPEEDADVLVWNELGIEIAAYTTNPVKRWYSYTGQEVFAKYWMQLPEPPKEDDA